MVGTKQEIIAKLQEMYDVEDDEVIVLDLWTRKDIKTVAVTNEPITDEQIADVMRCVDKDLRNESTYATVRFAIECITL